MRVLVVKDGTVPVMVAEVLYSDPADLGGTLDKLTIDGQDVHETLELFEVPGEGHEGLDVTWSEDMGFSVSATTLGAWLKEVQHDEEALTIEEVSPGHLAVTFGFNPDRESYGHFFDLRRWVR